MRLIEPVFCFLLVGAGVANGVETPEWLPSQGRPGGFVSSDACKSCHTDEYNSWHRSFHRTMTQYATNDAVKADFKNVKLNFHGETFQFEKQDGEYWVSISEQVAAQPANNEKNEPLRLPIGMVTGFHHMQVFWMPAGPGNEQLGFPFTWLNEDQRWVPREATFLRDPKLLPPKELWNITCVRCHTTAPQPKPDAKSSEFRTRVAEMGIACEACHGPGERHVEFQNGLRAAKDTSKTKARDKTIVHPARLEHDRASEICAQCHSMRYFDQKSGWLEHGFAYRPGENIEEATPVMRPRIIDQQPWLKRAAEKTPGLLDDFFWRDGMIRVSGREYNGLIESPCYQRGKLSCLSCHSMHESDPNDQLKAGMESNTACLQCHTTKRENITAHTHHAVTSEGSQCYNCHMPNTTYGLLKAIRSHEISNPTVSESVTVGRPNACNLCHLDKSLAWTAEYLKTWYKTNSPALSEEQQKIPAGILWALKGDAGQRALAAWHFGWKPAQEASGSKWMGPFVAPLLNDSYAAVRYIAGRTVRSLTGFETFRYDFVAEEPARERAAKAVAEHWQQAFGKTQIPITLDQIPKLLEQQNGRPLHLRE